MTDPPSYANSSVAPSAQARNEPITSPTNARYSLYNSENTNDAEEDDSTIKCICGFKQDDGNSVQCEQCETWQHTECYYYDVDNRCVSSKDELDEISHFCNDCRPRALDVPAAIARQRHRFGDSNHDEKKAKKHPPKSHKKKTKGTDTNGIHTNGWSPDPDVHPDRTSRSPRDPVTSNKRPKTHHRSSQSLGLSALSPYPTSHPHKRSASALQSPTKAVGRNGGSSFIKENYTPAFMRLYVNDPGEKDLDTNFMNDITITGDLSAWAYDVDALRQATRGFSHSDVFKRTASPLREHIHTTPRKRSKSDERVIIDGRHPRWIFLTNDGVTETNGIIGELKGKVGHMTNYISSGENNWDWLRHPKPFVFFHPKLPIYIDTRSEGTICRYLRRSCRPNLSMTTILEENHEYHFCFTAKERIEPGAELTIGWTLDEHMRNFISNKPEMQQDLSPEGEDYAVDWVGKVSAEFGGCACGRPDSCWFVQYDQEYRNFAKGKSGLGRRKQPPNPPEISDGDDEGQTSCSNSGSRAHSPTGATMAAPALGLDISEREKRKIAMLEKNLENDRSQPATKKKKRNSGPSSTNPSAPSAAIAPSDKDSKPSMDDMQPRFSAAGLGSISLPNTPGFPSRTHTDTGISRTKSGSPTTKGPNGYIRPKSGVASKTTYSQPSTPVNPSPTRPGYVNKCVQTDPDLDGDWLQQTQDTRKTRKPFVSMTKRLLIQSQREHRKLEEMRKSVDHLSLRGSSALLSPGPKHDVDPEPKREDSVMLDVGGVTGEVKVESGTEQRPNENLPSHEPLSEKVPSWPPNEHAVAVDGLQPSNPDPDPDPHQASLPVESVSTNSLTQTPVSPAAHSLLSGHPSLLPPAPAANIQPSPAKKKISLSDYAKRRSSHAQGKTGVGSPEMQHRSLKSPLPTTQGDQTMEDSAIVDTPKKEEKDPLETASDAGKVMAS